jgi:hypothetical protein
MSPETHDDTSALILAAEDCSPEEFSKLHRFSTHDRRIIRKLIAHGPVLLRGGRGSGKSALMIEASRQLAPFNKNGDAIGVYISLRYLPLLRSTGEQYEQLFCNILKQKLSYLGEDFDVDIPGGGPSVSNLQHYLALISARAGKRIVLFFDDAAHIGREASLAEFFDLYRMLSSHTVSCKASIYPGVTRFGTRFDVYNDATTVDISRSTEAEDFSQLLFQVFEARYPYLSAHVTPSSDLTKQALISFLGKAVLGNMRAFVYACNALAEKGHATRVGFNFIGELLKDLSGNYYWPLIEELRPKLGVYEPIADAAISVAEVVFKTGGQHNKNNVLIHRDIVSKLQKTMEMLEYAGFITRREVSRAMKSGGRGTRYSLNLCNLLEHTQGARMTKDLFVDWNEGLLEPYEFHRGGELAEIAPPVEKSDAEPTILSMPVDSLKKSNAYPYGLSELKIKVLVDAGYVTIGDVADAAPGALQILWSVGPKMEERIKNVVGQAIWM